ncbi:uncharacterized protein [Prorops nasuta]|uniref:uncharacterized protein n=1 Tax=Prorops nasuta TaxID=863751 RepID=UPI0034CD7A93
MSGKVTRVSSGPIMRAVYEFLLGRPPNEPRWPKEIAARTQPLPNLPSGPNHKLSKIAYHVRDTRRDIRPIVVIGDTKALLLGDGKKQEPKKNAEYPVTKQLMYGHVTYEKK